jgi:predicted N-acetyltransferase YhbS
MGSISVEATNLRLDFFDDKVRYPALLLGRVAVDNDFRKRDIGRCMCMWAVGLARKLSRQLGCRFVVLSTKDESRITFYKKCGFQICPESKKKRKKRLKKSSSSQEEDLKLMYFQIF